MFNILNRFGLARFSTKNFFQRKYVLSDSQTVVVEPEVVESEIVELEVVESVFEPVIVEPSIQPVFESVVELSKEAEIVINIGNIIIEKNIEKVKDSVVGKLK